MKGTNSNVYCEVCCTDEAKYRCPGCNTRTCSVRCVKAHKIERECDGRRCKTAYISQSEFYDNHLLNDYRFLEEVGCYVDSIDRDSLVRSRQKKNYGLNLHRFKTACRRRNISFLYQDSMMTKRLQNSIGYNRKRDMISWKVEWIFADIDDASFTDHRVCEDTPLKVLLEKYLHPTDSDPVIRHRLQKYVLTGGVDNVKVFMKVEWKQLKGPRYYKMDVTRGLRENLSYKTVIEYPTLHVCIGRSSSAEHYVVYERSVDHAVTTVPQSLTTRASDDDGNLGNDVISVPRHDMAGEPQPIGYSAIQCDNTNPHPYIPGEQYDTETEKKGNMIHSHNEGANALELLMGQYHDSDSELEPGEVL